MGGNKFRRAVGAMKDQTSIGIAKVGSTSSSFSDLEIAIIQASSHDETPPHNSSVRQILYLSTYSRPMLCACITTIGRRLNRTSNWVVALKLLMLIHHLLNEGDQTFEHEIHFAKRRGSRFLSMAGFRDRSSDVSSWDYSAFVRTYALYLDEMLQFRMLVCTSHAVKEEDETEGEDEDEVQKLPHEMNNENIFSRAHHLSLLLQRFLACRPTGAAKYNRVVDVALHLLVKESFKMFDDTKEVMAAMTERFMQLEIPDMVRVYEIFCQASKQYDELDVFYDWCKHVRIMPPSKFPNIDQIPQKKLEMMDDFIRQKSKMLENRKAITANPVKEEENGDDTLNDALPGFMEKTDQDQVKEELLDLYKEVPNTEQQLLALTLVEDSPAPPVEAFGDWETKLVQSTSHLSIQNTSLPVGLNTLMLDCLYQQGASSGHLNYGPPMLLSPAPQAVTVNSSATNMDPFEASVGIAPPAYVQMSDMERQQRLLLEQQMLWWHGRIQGQLVLGSFVHQQYPYR